MRRRQLALRDHTAGRVAPSLFSENVDDGPNLDQGRRAWPGFQPSSTENETDKFPPLQCSVVRRITIFIDLGEELRLRLTDVLAYAPMCFEEVIDDVFAVVLAHGVESGHACERQRSDELAHGQFDVEVVKLVARLGALEDGVERLSVLVDDPRS